MYDANRLMQLAIAKAKEGIAAGQSPFGCAVARGDELIAIAYNTVQAATDITAHAEINAIRLACQKTSAILLEDCRVATTCEPCPMCMSALHWARVREVVYGASIADATSAGFNELPIPAAKVVELGQSPVQLTPNVLRDECRELFGLWSARPDRVAY